MNPFETAMVAKMPPGEAITLSYSPQCSETMAVAAATSSLGVLDFPAWGRRLLHQSVAAGAGVSRRTVQPSQSRCRRDHPGRPIGRAGSPAHASEVPRPDA